MEYPTRDKRKRQMELWGKQRDTGVKQRLKWRRGAYKKKKIKVRPYEINLNSSRRQNS